MKTFVIPFLLFMLAFIPVKSQVYMDLQDNMEIPSNSWVIINPGNYNIPDPGNDGLIQINNKENIIIEGPGVTANGADYSGYVFKIDNSSNIEIRDFDLISHYYYAAYITNSGNISIHDNDFSYNKVDSAGWIYIWTNYQNALGGGVMMHNCQVAEFYNNLMKYQNDGVALYECDSILVHNNDFSWNTSFGIRMYFTDYCDIQENNCAHVNRPYTDPSDCAAILLIVSNENYVVNNDFTYSGDGIFLGQYEYSQIPNNNFFAYNECSYSPHNAIEATFADGNVYIGNICNYSHYGFWLGYSFNSLVDSNEVIGNQHSGIAIDRGYNNMIVNNVISENPTGIELWEGDPIPPYQNQESRIYHIYDNLIEGNTVAIYAGETEQMFVRYNEFLHNRNGIFLEGNSELDSITHNVFRNPAFYYIENQSPDYIYAVQNDFIIDDESIISCKILDKNDNSAYGEVIWQPYVPGDPPVFQNGPPVDIAEPGAVWYAYPEACWGYGLHEPTYTEWDYEEKVAGEASVHVATANGWDIGTMSRPGGDTLAAWSLAESDTLIFWLKSINNTGYGFQFCHVVLGNNCGGYYKYTASASLILNPTIGQWKEIKMPLTGGSPWNRTVHGNVSFAEISFVEIHADTWEFGFELWIDGVTFSPALTGEEDISQDPGGQLNIYPQPAGNMLFINGINGDESIVAICDMTGKTVLKRTDVPEISQDEPMGLDISALKSGIYLLEVKEDNVCRRIKIIKQ